MIRLLTFILLSFSFLSVHADLLKKNPFKPKQDVGLLTETIINQHTYADTNSELPIIMDDKSGVLELNYGEFTLWLECKSRRTVRFSYIAKSIHEKEKRAQPMNELDKDDRGKFLFGPLQFDPPTTTQYFREKHIPKDCQQTSTLSYGTEYVRAHLVNPAHLTNFNETNSFAHSMINVFPLNKAAAESGAWKHFGNLITEYRQNGDVMVTGELHWRIPYPSIITHSITPPSTINVTLEYIDKAATHLETLIIHNLSI